MTRKIFDAPAMLLLVLAVALCTSVVSAKAQAKLKLTADVPFDFEVGETTFAAGEIIVRRISQNQNTLLVTTANGDQNQLRLTYPIRADEIQADGKLVFQRYGNRYFLTEVWVPGRQTGRQLSESNSLMALQREMLDYVTSTHPPVVETVTVLASLR